MADQEKASDQEKEVVQRSTDVPAKAQPASKKTAQKTDAPDNSESKDDEPTATETATTPKRKKSKKHVPIGKVHIYASFNNTIVTITDPRGAVLTTASAGSSGFHGSKKGTAFAAQVAADKALNNAKQAFGLTKADVIIRGIGAGRESAIRTLSSVGISVESLKDITAIPHGGVRPRKARRV